MYVLLSIIYHLVIYISELSRSCKIASQSFGTVYSDLKEKKKHCLFNGEFD